MSWPDDSLRARIPKGFREPKKADGSQSLRHNKNRHSEKADGETQVNHQNLVLNLKIYKNTGTYRCQQYHYAGMILQRDKSLSSPIPIEVLNLRS